MRLSGYPQLCHLPRLTFRRSSKTGLRSHPRLIPRQVRSGMSRILSCLLCWSGHALLATRNLSSALSSLALQKPLRSSSRTPTIRHEEETIRLDTSLSHLIFVTLFRIHNTEVVVHRDTVYVFLFYLVEIFHEYEYIIQVFFWTHLTMYVLAMSMYADGHINDDLPESRFLDTDDIIYSCG